MRKLVAGPILTTIILMLGVSGPVHARPVAIMNPACNPNFPYAGQTVMMPKHYEPNDYTVPSPFYDGGLMVNTFSNTEAHLASAGSHDPGWDYTVYGMLGSLCALLDGIQSILDNATSPPP